MFNRLGKLYQQDLNTILNACDLTQLNGKKVLVTGASGLIGSCIVDLLVLYNLTRGGDIQIFACGRTQLKLQSEFGFYFPFDEAKLNFIENDITKGDLVGKWDYIFHCASPTQSMEMKARPSGVMLDIINGTRTVLNCLTDNGTFVYLSSCEVYGDVRSGTVSEKQCGDIDLMNTRSCYIEGKRASELLSRCYVENNDRKLIVVRPGKVFGPMFSENDNRACAAFFRDAVTKSKITIKNDGRQYFTFTYVIDCVYLIMLALSKCNEKVSVYNVATYQSQMSIRDFAYKICRALGITYTFGEGEGFVVNGYAGTNCLLDGSKAYRELEYQDIIGVDSGIKHTILELYGED